MILQNPFYILGATTRDNRKKILELAEEQSLEIDEELCQKARSDLTIPRNRILAELDWFPGVSPRKVESIVSQIKSGDKNLYSLESIPDLARINILIELIDTEIIKFSNDELEKIIISVVYNFEKLDMTRTIQNINEDRTVSGFPEVNDYALVENHISEKKGLCVKVILKRLNNLSTVNLIDIMTKIVDDETKNGEIQAPLMIEYLVDDYKLHTQNFLEQEQEKIIKLAQIIKEKASEGESSIASMVDKLLTIASNWDKVAQPIQLSMKSRGLADSMSNQIAYIIRDLAIELYNSHKMLNTSKKISKILLELFKELPDIELRVQEDISTLNDIEENNKSYAKKILMDIGVKGIEGLTSEEILNELKSGATVKRFKYCHSFLVVTYNKNSPAIFIKSNESYFGHMLPYLLNSLILGWWGFPWGPIYTIGDIFQNIFGGENLTNDINKIIKSNN